MGAFSLKTHALWFVWRSRIEPGLKPKVGFNMSEEYMQRLQDELAEVSQEVR